ncbi:hypothetical protein [Duganella sp. CF458]|uniref:hypothetical protein n=1 Tax=Duganella sp. CF458 TaxID=1884368 RepID=UPI001113C99C|nr:hypothetical protein [Duganella sp. CF458]
MIQATTTLTRAAIIPATSWPMFMTCSPTVPLRPMAAYIVSGVCSDSDAAILAFTLSTNSWLSSGLAGFSRTFNWSAMELPSALPIELAVAQVSYVLTSLATLLLD